MSVQTDTKTNPLVEKGLSLPLMEDFYTIQGEGEQSGKAAYFIRLGGCDVGCVWCDVKESWDASVHPIVTIEAIVEKVKVTNADFAVITGGEPAMYDLGPLTALLQQNGIQTAIETSGAYPVSGTWHWICFSPKKFKQPVADVYPKANELKVIVYNKHDFQWAEEHAAKVKEDCKLFLQPEWDKSDEMLPLIIDYVKQHPKWNISLQTHKYMDIP